MAWRAATPFTGQPPGFLRHRNQLTSGNMNQHHVSVVKAYNPNEAHSYMMPMLAMSYDPRGARICSMNACMYAVNRMTTQHLWSAHLMPATTCGNQVNVQSQAKPPTAQREHRLPAQPAGLLVRVLHACAILPCPTEVQHGCRTTPYGGIRTALV